MCLKWCVIFSSFYCLHIFIFTILFYFSKSGIIVVQQLRWASHWYSLCGWCSDQGTRFDMNMTFSVTACNFLSFSILILVEIKASLFDWALKLSGRSKNVWESPLGCLMFSFTLQMEDGRVVPLVQYVVSLAITEAIKDICDKNVRVLFWSTGLTPSLLVDLISESFSEVNEFQYIYKFYLHDTLVQKLLTNKLKSLYFDGNWWYCFVWFWGKLLSCMQQ